MYEATGTRELYQPIQSCHVVCLGYPTNLLQYPDRTAIIFIAHLDGITCFNVCTCFNMRMRMT